MADSIEKVVQLQRKSLKRVLGVSDLFAVGYGDVGSSIYYALGATALYALGATPLALAIAGLVFICTSLTYAEMSATFPEPGGSATFSRYAFNDLISFIAGWGLLLDYVVTIAISAFAIPPYIQYILDLFGLSYLNTTPLHCAVTIGIIVFLYAINVLGIKQSGHFSFLLATVTILSQVFVIGLAGLFMLNLPFVIDHMRIGVPGADWSPSGWEFLKGVAMAMVAYTGIEAIAQLAAEAKKPTVTIPRAIKWTMGTLVILYFGISVVGLSVVSPQELGTTYLEDPIAGIVIQFPYGGKILAPWFGLIAAIILLIASNAGLIGCSRLTFSMGEYYQVPRLFYRLHERFRTPHVSLGIFALIASLVVLASRGQMLFLADLYNFGAQIAFFSAHMSLLVLRWKKPELERPYRAPFNIPFGKKRSLPLTALFGAFASFSVWVLVFITKPEGRNLGIIWILLGMAMYFYYRKKKKLTTTGQLSVEKIKVPEYRPVQLKQVLIVTRLLGDTESLQTAFQLAKVHGAQVTAVYVLEVPTAMPMHAPLEKRELQAAAALKRADAVAREYNLTIEMEIVRARSIETAILNLIERQHFDLVVIGADKKEFRTGGNFVSQAERLFEKAPCRMIFCKS